MTNEEARNFDDGIRTQVEVDMDEHDILDYKDDLSMEEEGIEDTQLAEEVVEKSSHDKDPNGGVSGDDQPVPGTSGTQSQDIVQELSAQSEEQLMENLVIQNMMKKFFENQFKNMQMTQAQEKEKTTEKGRQANVQQVKSPSDTTIYAPALNKRITPVNKGGLDTAGCVYERMNPVMIDNHFDSNISNIGANQIANFVEAVRLDQHPTNRRKLDNAAAELNEARNRADEAIVNVE